MFTGLIETQGAVVESRSTDCGCELLIHANLQDLSLGDSIAVNGVCLTLKAIPNEATLCFDVSPETLNCTTLGNLSSGNVVNIEQAMGTQARFGGHYVSGHVDTTVVIQAVKTIESYVELTVGPFRTNDLLYLIPKGSITLDGVSLTINHLDGKMIKMMLVPHTLLHTNLQHKQAGDWLNVEFDYLARVVAHQLKMIKEHTDGSVGSNPETQEV